MSHPVDAARTAHEAATDATEAAAALTSMFTATQLPEVAITKQLITEADDTLASQHQSLLLAQQLLSNSKNAGQVRVCSHTRTLTQGTRGRD